MMTMSKKKFEYHYGKTKLDHVLTYICDAFEKVMVFVCCLLTLIGVIEQVIIYSENNPEQMIPVLLGAMALMCVGAAYEIDKLIREHKEEK